MTCLYSYIYVCYILPSPWRIIASKFGRQKFLRDIITMNLKL